MKQYLCTFVHPNKEVETKNVTGKNIVEAMSKLIFWLHDSSVEITSIVYQNEVL